MRIGTVLILTLTLAIPLAAQRPAGGPLRPLSSNPRWFTDGSGRAIYLAGSHSWNVLGGNYAGFLDFLTAHHHNLFRLWARGAAGPDRTTILHPWKRTGPGTAADGGLKFDLTRLDDDYFARLRSAVIAARDRGIYVDVMLFEGYGLQFSENSWKRHPFNAANNINAIEADIDKDGKGLEYNAIHDSAMGRRVYELQQAYAGKVIETLNDLDNVLYEISNESFPGSTEWQYRLIRFIKDCESRKPKQHPVGMTFQYKGGTNTTLYYSPADWISPNAGESAQDYRYEPCADCTGKIVINDTDHLWGHTGGDSVWVWKSFTRGLHVLFMEELPPSPAWEDSARLGMGQTVRYAERMNLAGMTPESKLTDTGYCLAARGREYLVFQPGNKGLFNLDLSGATGTFEVEWLDVTSDKTVPGKPVQGGGQVHFRTPFPGAAAVYLRLAK